jgi:hypothetical protein
MQRLDAPSLRPDCPKRHRERVNDLMYPSVGRREPYALTSHMQRLLPRCHAALAVIEAVTGVGLVVGRLGSWRSLPPPSPSSVPKNSVSHSSACGGSGGRVLQSTASCAP